MTGIICALPGIIKPAAAAGARTAKTITAQGTAQVKTAQSKFGGASVLVGSNNLNGIFVASTGLSDLADWNSYTQFTAECWVRYTDISQIDDGGYPATMGIMERNDWPFTWSMGADRNGAVGFHYRTTANNFISHKSSNSQVVANTWYHIAAVKNGSTVKVYLDGVEKVSATISGTPSADLRPLSIGSYYRVGASAYIDEMRISKTARYTAGFTPSTSAFTNDADTLFLCHADGTDSSTVFTDDTGSRFKIGVSALGNAKVSTAQSKFGGASAFFDGTGDYLLIQNNSIFDFTQTNVTLEMWIRPSSVTVTDILMSKRVSSASGWQLNVTTSSGVAFQCYQDGSSPISLSGGSLSANTWYHIAVTKSSNTFKLYVAGSEVSSDTLGAGEAIQTNTSNIGIGRWLENTSFDYTGYIDEIRLSHSLRYTGNFTPSSTAFTNDADTKLLIHCNGTDASTTFTDDNA